MINIFVKIILFETKKVSDPIIRKKQFDFRKEYSMMHQLIHLVDRISDNTNNKAQWLYRRRKSVQQSVTGRSSA